MKQESYSITTYNNSSMSIDMKDYKESFNMMFGTNDISINLLSNPYLQFNVYEFDQKWNIKMSENIKLKQC